MPLSNVIICVVQIVCISFRIFPCYFPSNAQHRPNVTPNAQESEDSGLSLGYSSTDAAKRMSSSSSSINSEQDHDRDMCDDDGRDFRRHHGSTTTINMINGNDGHGSGDYDFR